MKRTAFLCFLLTFSVCYPAYSHTFEAIISNKNVEEAVLHDTATGDDWVVTEGDEIDGYQIVKITPSYVTIAKPGEGRVVFVTQIPIINEQRILKINP